MKKIPTLLDLYEAIKPYTIYCDMDGVLCDFNQGYEKLTGESTDEANTKGKSYFWKLFRESVGKNEKDFWANLPWQPGGEELWNYIKSSSPNILSAPAVDFNLPQDQQLNPEFNQAIQGKKEWIAKNLSGVGKEIFEDGKRYGDEYKVVVIDKSNLEYVRNKILNYDWKNYKTHQSSPNISKNDIYRLFDKTKAQRQNF